MNVMLLAVSVGAFSAGGLCTWWALAARGVARRIEATHTRPINSLLAGALAEVQGKARRAADDRPLVSSPLSDAPCLLFHLVIELEKTTRRRTSKGRSTTDTSWVTLVDDRQQVPFVIDDGTGQVGVDLERAEVLLAEDVDEDRRRWLDSSRASTEEGRRLADALARYGRSADVDRLRYRETMLREGDGLYALGTFAGGLLRRIREDVLIVSDRGERAVVAEFSGRFRNRLAFAALLAVVGVVFLDLGLHPGRWL